MLKKDQLRINCTMTNIRKYKRISNESRKFSKTYAKFIRETSQPENVEDYIMALRTHLFMKNFKMKRINTYINEIVIPQMNQLIEKNVRMFKKDQKNIEEL